MPCRPILRAFLMFAALATVHAASASDLLLCEKSELHASDASAASYFGTRIDLDGDRSVIGTYGFLDAGFAYFFERTDGQWVEVQKVSGSDAVLGSYFGWSTGISGNHAIVGALGDESAGFETGAAYMFTWDGKAWSETQKLVASDAAAGDRFGYSVDISGDAAIVGAYGNNLVGGNSGSAYIFRLVDGKWIEEVRLQQYDAAPSDEFGISVAIDGDRAVVGSYRDDDMGEASGSAYVYLFDGKEWVIERKLVPQQSGPFDLVGTSVAIDFPVIALSAHLSDVAGEMSGAIYAYRYEAGAFIPWGFATQLAPHDGAEGDFFGWSVTVSGDTIAASSHLDDDSGTNSGSAYIFKWDGAEWYESQKIIASDGALGDTFGYPLAIQNDEILVDSITDDFGSASGSVYVFNAEGEDCNRNGVPDECDITSGASKDLDGDGIPDECSMPLIPGDLDRDGDVDFTDLLALLAAWGECEGDCPADLDLSGGVGFADLLVLLANWS